MKEIIVRSYRGDVVECDHLVSFAILDSSGKVILEAGNLSRNTYLRSLAKPFQCLPLYETGAIDAFKLTLPDIAIIVSSHNGEKIHVDQVRAVLMKGGLEEQILECGIHLPFNLAIAQKIMQENAGLLPIHNNCSGKHAGMLLLCKHLGLPIKNYHAINHPLQKFILEREAEIFKKEQFPIGIDGCGVPTVALPLREIAELYAKFAIADTSESLGKIRKAIIENPMLIAGSGRFETIVMKQLPIIAKSGADGLMAIGIPKAGVGIIVKVHSGIASIADYVMLNLLVKLKILSEEEIQNSPLNIFYKVLNCRNELVGHYEIINAI